ncbi:uncharacterized protein [Nicotiana sylvestris]|uniref:uncharacterized protein n=1 Tax=Nicotiana sylvestris TaxID=4096 RepID=UPI00388CAC3F
MAAPPNFEKGHSTYRPPRFNGQYYGWWKKSMHDFIMAEDTELWDVICDGPFVPMKTIGEPAMTVPKTRKEYNNAERKAIEKNFRAKKILVCGIGPDEYNRIFACQFGKGVTIIPRNKLVRKILSVLPGSWESKVNAITEAKDLQKLTIDKLIDNLKTYEMKKKNKVHERREPKREKNLVLKTDNNDSSGEDAHMAYLTKRFQKMVRRNGGIPKRGSSSKPRGYDLCHKYGNPGYFIQDCPLHKQQKYKHNTYKAAKRNPVPDKRFKRKDVTDNVVKQALAALGDSSSESREDDEQDYSSMMVVESEAAEYDSIFALMGKSDEDEEDENMLTVELGEVEIERDDLLVVVVDLKETIDGLKKEKYALTEKVENIEHERDDLLVVVVDLKETIVELKREGSHEITQKGKEVANEVHLRLENELKSLKSSLCAELDRNKQLQEDLGRVKNGL